MLPADDLARLCGQVEDAELLALGVCVPFGVGEGKCAAVGTVGVADQDLGLGQQDLHAVVAVV